MISEQNFGDIISQALEEGDTDLDINNVMTFEEAGILTHNKGLVVTLVGGEEFQVTIVKSN